MKTFEKNENTEKRTIKKQFVRRSERETQERVESRRINASCRKPPGVEKER